MGLASEIVSKPFDVADRLADNERLLGEVRQALKDALLMLDVHGLASVEYRAALAYLYACQLAWIEAMEILGRDMGQPDDPRFGKLRTLAQRNVEGFS